MMSDPLPTIPDHTDPPVDPSRGDRTEADLTAEFRPGPSHRDSPAPGPANPTELLPAEAPAAGDNPLLTFLGPAAGPGQLGRLGPYAVLEILGSGAVGVVFKGYEPKLNRFVAIKALA